MAVRRLVAYDVSSDRSRARLAALLSQFGLRRQKSVFECSIPDSGFAEFVARCEQLIDVERDVVIVMSECDRCHGDRVMIGQAGADLDVGFWIVGVDPVVGVKSVREHGKSTSGAQPGSQGALGGEDPFPSRVGDRAEWRAKGSESPCSEAPKIG